MFRSGFQMCAKEVLQYVAKHETSKDLKSSQLISHLQRVASEVLQSGASRKSGEAVPKLMDMKENSGSLTKAAEAHGRNCVPVIQRTFAHSSGEQSGSDTDTDSGYGGELEKSDSKSDPQYFKKDTELKYSVQERLSSIKQENEDPPAKRTRMETSEDDGHFSNDVLGSPSSFLGPHPHQPPLCLPFYLIPPSATAYLPMLEKCWYPASVPVLYPSLPASTAALSGLINPDKMSSPLLMSQRLPSPVPSHSPMDSTALLHALRQMSPLNLETKE